MVPSQRLDARFDVRAVGVAVAVALLPTLVGCTNLRNFLIPPANHARVRADQTKTPSLILDSVMLPGEATVNSVAIGEGSILHIAPASAVPVGAPAMMHISRRGLRAEPSWSDAHIHLSGAAQLQDAVALTGAATMVPAAFAEAVGGRIRSMRPGGWVWCLGAQEPLLQALGEQKLAQLVGAAPVWISAADGHGALLSPGALKLLPGPLAETVRKRGGRVEGELARHAWRAMPLAPGRTMALMVALLRKFASEGVGEVHTMGESVAVMRMLELLAKQHRLPIRVRVYLDAADPDIDEVLTRGAATVSSGRRLRALRDPRSRLQLAGLKVWLDGSLGARTAMLRSPYRDGAGSGEPEASDETLAKALARSDAAGLQLAVHAVGDGAIERLLAVLASANRPDGAQPVRIEHAQVVAPDQLARLKGMLCSIQPLHRQDDAAFADARLGAERVSWAYRASSLQATCPLLLGSDLPIGRADPNAMTQELQGRTDPSRPAAERLGPDEAIAGLLRDPKDGRTRLLKVGEPADMRLLDGDTLVALIVGGEIAWRTGGRL